MAAFKKSAKMSEEQAADILFKKRFAETTNKDLKLIVDNKDAKNTKRATSLAVKIFCDYLKEKTINTDFENCTAYGLS